MAEKQHESSERDRVLTMWTQFLAQKAQTMENNVSWKNENEEKFLYRSFNDTKYEVFVWSSLVLSIAFEVVN